MGSFWIFFLFLGIVALVKRNEIANESKKSQSEQPPVEDIRREFERRLKELRGEIPPQGSAQPMQRGTMPHPTLQRPAVPRPVAPRPATAQSAMPHTTTAQPATPRTTTARPARPSVQPNAQIQQAAQQGSAIRPSNNTAQNNQHQPNATAPKSEVERMVEDFSIEKAVIYSEILEPKFKQF